MSGVGPRSANTYTVAPPSNYVAGVGRGAMGFTTRSDIGPARPGPPSGAAPTLGAPPVDPQFGQAPAGYVAGRGRGMGDLARGQEELTQKHVQQDLDRGDYSESNYDEFSGYGEKLFTTSHYEEDDAEADQIYDIVDGIMDSRRKRSREQQMLLDKKRAKNERPRIADQFADLKDKMASVTTAEWESIPEVGDHSLKLTQSRKMQTFMPVPDSLIEAAQRATTAGTQMVNSIDPNSIEASGILTSIIGSSVGGSSNSGVSSSVGSGSGRNNALTSRLDEMSDSVSGQTVVDPKGYLTNLNSIKVSSTAEVGDIQRARILLQSVTSTNPKHGPGWIAAARVEEYANKINIARKIILHGCEQCPESEDVWLEAARLHTTDTAKTLLANAVLQLPTSVKIWLAAAELEVQDVRKKAVLRRSLEYIPNSVALWKAAIELENVTDARIMLARAVECVPHSVEMWLALAKLETHTNARLVLNQARQAIPTERTTWITAAKLEEANNNAHLVPRIIEKMIISLTQYQVITSREVWISEAEQCEHNNALITCTAIINNTIGMNIELEDQVSTWMDDCEVCLSHTPLSLHTARCILNYALLKYPTKKRLYQQYAMLEKDYGTSATLEHILQTGVTQCPTAEVLWLMYAKEKWNSGDIHTARTLLQQAFVSNTTSQQIWLAAIKLEWENNEYERARLLLHKARTSASSERVWLKSALLEVEVGNTTECLVLLQQAIQLYPHYAKFYLMAGQVLCGMNEPVKARNMYLQGIQHTSTSSSGTTSNTNTTLITALWRALIQLEERVKGVIRARPTGEQARLQYPTNEYIWLECIRLERRSGNDKLADTLMSKALKVCPKSGVLWSEEILTCTKQLQKSRCIDALKVCVDDVLVLVAVARLFERGGSIEKARRRYNRALTLNPRYGDGWCYYYAMEYVQLYKSELIRSGVLGRAGSGGASGGSGVGGSVGGGVGGSSGVGGGSIAGASGGGSSVGGSGNSSASSASVVDSTTTGRVLSAKEQLQLYGGIDSVDDNEEDDLPVSNSSTSASTSVGIDSSVGIGAGSANTSSNGSGNGSSNTTSTNTSTNNTTDNTTTDERPVGYTLDIIATHIQTSQPNQGEVWCSVSKETKLRRLSPAALLPIVVERILGYAPVLHTICVQK